MKQPTKPKSNQDAFDRTYRALVFERVPKSHFNKACRYRMRYQGQTISCAIGRLLPDSKLNTVQDGGNNSLPVHVLIYDHPSMRKWFENVDTNLLCALQDAHDESGVKGVVCGPTMLAERKRALKLIAKGYKLTIPHDNSDPIQV